MFFLSDHTVISQWPWTSVGIECIHTATKSLFVYHSGTPSIFSQLISPAGRAGAASGRATMWQWSIILIQSGDRDQGVTDHCWAQSQPRQYSVFWTGLCSIINIQRSESLRVRYQNQSWLMMIMTIYNDDDIFVLAKHQVLVKISPVQSSAVRKGISQRPGSLTTLPGPAVTLGWLVLVHPDGKIGALDTLDTATITLSTILNHLGQTSEQISQVKGHSNHRISGYIFHRCSLQ